jgi:hypothetical protein
MLCAMMSIWYASAVAVGRSLAPGAAQAARPTSTSAPRSVAVSLRTTCSSRRAVSRSAFVIAAMLRLTERRVRTCATRPHDPGASGYVMALGARAVLLEAYRRVRANLVVWPRAFFSCIVAAARALFSPPPYLSRHGTCAAQQDAGARVSKCARACMFACVGGVCAVPRLLERWVLAVAPLPDGWCAVRRRTT